MCFDHTHILKYDKSIHNDTIILDKAAVGSIEHE